MSQFRSEGSAVNAKTDNTISNKEQGMSNFQVDDQ